MVLRSVASVIFLAPAVIVCLSGGTPVSAKSYRQRRDGQPAPTGHASGAHTAAVTREPPLQAALCRHARLRARTGHTLPPARTQLSPALPREAGTCVLNTSAGSSRMTSTSYLFFCHLTFTGIVPAMVPMQWKSVQRLQTQRQAGKGLVFVFAQGQAESRGQRREGRKSEDLPH